MTETPTPLCYMSFKPGNGLACGQDMRFFTGVPAGVTFAVYPFASARRQYRLVAPGYGAAGDYGNGALYVTFPEAEGAGW